jgi:hypothetical protein
MTLTTLEAVEQFRALLEAETGVAASLEALKEIYGQVEVPPACARVLFARVPPELHEKTVGLRYPLVHVYCDRLESQRTERFRRFSGVMRMVVEVRMSQDRLEGMTEKLHWWVDAIRDVVERSAGCVGGVMYLDGDYQVSIDPVRKGGLNYLQVGKITCPVIVNRS